MQPEILQLRDIHLPDPVSWWPPAPGWWLAALLLMLGLSLIMGWRYQARRPPKFKAAVLAELATLSQDLQLQPDTSRLACELSMLLRRACRCLDEQEISLGLTGEAWLAHLDTRLHHGRLNHERPEDDGHASPDFSTGVGRALLSAPYQATSNIDGPALIKLVERWAATLPKRLPKR